MDAIPAGHLSDCFGGPPVNLGSPCRTLERFMKIRTLSVLAAALALAGGCHRTNSDASKVLANVAGQKISQADFEEMVKGMVPDPSKAKALMQSPAFQAQKADLVRQLAMQKAVIAFARNQGLDRDPAVRAQIEGATAQAYFQAIIGRRADPAKAAPTEAQLQGMYQEIKAKSKDIPPFDQVKPQLAQGYGQWLFQKELKAAIPITYSDEIGEPGS